MFQLHFIAVHPRVRHLTQNHKCEPCCSSRGKVRRSPESLTFILWVSLLRYFCLDQSGGLTDRQTDDRQTDRRQKDRQTDCQADIGIHSASMARNVLKETTVKLEYKH